MTHQGERPIITRENRGGSGTIQIEHLLTQEQMGPGCRMVARTVLPPGSLLAYHEHHGEAEAYYILSGRGIFDDGEGEKPVKAGDVTYTGDGDGHGLSNPFEEDLVFLAIILKNISK